MLASVASVASAAENGLLGIKLFDTGVRVVSVYGSPNEIQAVNIGGMGAGGGGGVPGGAPGGGPGAPPGFGGGGRPMGGGGGGGAPMSPDFSFGDFIFRQGVPVGGPMSGGGGMAGAPTMGGGPGGMAPPSRGGPGGPGASGGPPGAGGGAATNATFTRWVYNRTGSKYGFIIDNKGRVVQIEAIGLANSRVRTSKGVTFGDSFAEVIKKYQTPDGYDINGDNVMARFLTRSKVAFRFSRLGPNKPQVVTGIVVAAGKG